MVISVLQLEAIHREVKIRVLGNGRAEDLAVLLKRTVVFAIQIEINVTLTVTFACTAALDSHIIEDWRD